MRFRIQFLTAWYSSLGLGRCNQSRGTETHTVSLSAYTGPLQDFVPASTTHGCPEFHHPSMPTTSKPRFDDGHDPRSNKDHCKQKL